MTNFVYTSPYLDVGDTRYLTEQIANEVDKKQVEIKQYVDEQIEDVIAGQIDLTSYAKKTEVAEGLATKQDRLTFDNAPTIASDNPVKSGGVYSALESKADNEDIPTKTSDLTNDSHFVSDASYVHTDNNFTTAEKTKLDGIDLSNYATKDELPEIEVTQTLASGTEIARIDVDGDETILYAPAGGGGSITVDDALSTTSTNPVQNRVVTNALNNKADASAVPTKTSDLTNDSNYVTSTELNTALASKQNTLTFDNIPVANSDNPAKSGGIYTALSGKADIASPTFTGVPTGPTAANGTNTTQLATTAFVQNALGVIENGSY